MDLITMLANAANQLSAIGIKLVLTIADVTGIVILILYLTSQAGKTRRGQVTDSAGSWFAVILLACCIIAIKSIATAGSHQLALGEVTYNAIAWVPESKYGPAAVAVNAGLTALQTIGWIYMFNGLLKLRRSQKDGHTGLSSGEDIASGVKRFLLGLLLACNPSVLNAIQNTIKLHW